MFSFQVDVLSGENGETFHTDTEILWVEFQDRVVGILGNLQKIQLSGKIAGEGKWGVLNSVEGLGGTSAKRHFS